MAKYFKYFPKTIYTLKDNATSVDSVTNIMTRFNFDKTFSENSAIFYNYRVKDGETPEMLADKIYGSSEKHWIILNFNNIFHPQLDWVLDSNAFNRYVNEKYSSRANTQIGQTGLEWAKENVYGYYNKTTQISVSLNRELAVDIVELDANTYANTATSTTNTITLQDGNQIRIDTIKYSKTYLEYEDEKNEEKRIIKILKPEFSASAEDELRKVTS
jgi:hypothetical protein